MLYLGSLHLHTPFVISPGDIEADRPSIPLSSSAVSNRCWPYLLVSLSSYRPFRLVLRRHDYRTVDCSKEHHMGLLWSRYLL